MVRLKAIESIKKLLCFLSSYIKLQSSKLCNPTAHYDDEGIRSDSGLFDRMRVIIFAIAIDLTIIGLIDPKAINFTHELHACVIGVAIKTRYRSHRSDFHRSDLSLRQFTSLINCTLGSNIHLGPNTVMIARPSSYKSKFICHFRITILSKGIIL